jgi:hypothetical protein
MSYNDILLNLLKSFSMTTIKKPEWFFYPAWIIIPVLCVPIAFALYFVITRAIIYFAGDFIYVNGVRHISEDYLLVYIFVPAIGLLTGSLQYGLLRRYLPRMGWWMPATLLGYALGLLLTLLLREALISSGTAAAFYQSSAQNVSFVFLGLSIGMAQWLLLRRRLPRAGWWIVANVVGWGLLALIIGGMLGLFGIMALGLLPSSVTAVMLGLLMNQLPPPEGQHV